MYRELQKKMRFPIVFSKKYSIIYYTHCEGGIVCHIILTG